MNFLKADSDKMLASSGTKDDHAEILPVVWEARWISNPEII